MLKEKWSIVLRKGFIISLSVLLTLSFALFSGGKKVYAYSSVALNSTHYRVEVSQTSNTSVTVSWAPSSNANSRYIDMVHITGTVGSSQPVVYLALYGSDSVTFSITSGVTTNWAISIDNTYNVGSELYNTGNISSYTSQILEEIQSLNSFLVIMNSNELQTQAFVSNINTQIQNIISNGLQVRLMNYDILLVQIPIIAYFVGNGGVIQSTNDFLSGKTLLFDYPIYKGYEGNSAYLTTDTTDDDYIMIVAVNSAYQIFTNLTYTPVSGWSDVSTVETGYKRYSNTLQFDYLIVKNNKNGSSYTGARYYINYYSGALTHLNNEQYIPIYYGKYSDCPQEFLDFIGLKTIEEQEGIDVSNDLDNINTDLNNEISAVDDIQNQLEDDFQDNIQAIDTDFDFETSFGQKFVTSAHWVRSQFETLTTQTPYGSILFFALTLGIAFMIIGRVI